MNRLFRIHVTYLNRKMQSGKQNQAYHPICFLSLWRLRLPVELSCGFCKLALGVTQLISWG